MMLLPANKFGPKHIKANQVRDLQQPRQSWDLLVALFCLLETTQRAVAYVADKLEVHEPRVTR